MRTSPPLLLALTLLVLILLVLILLTPASAAALTPHLVKDINTVPLAQGSFPQGYVEAGGLAFFTADDGESGLELWRTDGTVAGTFLVADACPGDCGSKPVVVATTGGSVFFQAFGRGFGPVDLWVSDGSPEGTVRLAGPLLLPDSGRRSVWIAGQGVLYFAANDLQQGVELWRSDGTPEGTFQVDDLRPGAAGSEPAELTEVGGRLFFSAEDGVRGPALWTSDGTGPGTRLVRDPLPGQATHRGPSLLRAVGRTLFFVAPVARRRDGLWRSDGTPGGTSPLVNFLTSSPPESAFLDAAVLGDHLLFVAHDLEGGRELWASDGTTGGTQALTRFALDSPFSPLGGSNPRVLPERPLGGALVFRADDGLRGVEPWITDGTRAGTRLLRDLCPGPCHGALSTDDAGIASTAAGDLLFFSAGNESRRGFELWTTDGTPAGTRLVRDLCRGSCSSEPRVLRAGDGEVFLLGRDSQLFTQLWRSDGTMPGTVRLTSFPSDTAFSGGALGTLLGDTFLFTAGDVDHGRELWRSDGTPAGTGLLLDLNPEDFGGSFPTELRTAAGKAWFFADDGLHGFELWTSDGTEEGTVLVDELTPGAAPDAPPAFESAVELDGQVVFLVQLGEPNPSVWSSEGPGSMVRLTVPELRVVASEPVRAAGGQVFFVAADAEHGEELWTMDGTFSGTFPVVDLVPGVQGSRPRSLTVFEDRLYFTAEVGETGRELWASDGTPEGTVLLRDIDPRPGRGSEPQLLTPHAGRLYFPAADEEHGRELWSTDGTPAGTTLAAEITPGPDGVFMTHLVSTGSNLYFSGGPAGVTQQGLWVSDGTAAGTRRLSQKLIHIDAREIGAPVAWNGRLFFASDSDEILWQSDGTEEGTGPLLDAEGLEIDEPEAFRLFAGRLFFTTGLTSLLYETDGTPEGTAVVQGLAAPFELGNEAASFELVTVGDRLLFRAWERTTGSELWALEGE